MDILLFGAPRLARWDGRAESGVGRRASDHADVYERDVAREAPGEPSAGGPHRAVAAAILRYQIFPPELVTGVIRRPIERGDTVGVLYRGFPLVRLFFAARVTEVFDGPPPDGAWWRTGFTYRTLAGHPELGEETFAVETELATGRVRVALRSWSRPGILLAHLGRPLLRAVQVRASRRALDHLEGIARGVRDNRM